MIRNLNIIKIFIIILIILYIPCLMYSKKRTKEFVWPLPPEKPRIRWIAEYRTIEEFRGESKLKKLIRKLAGIKMKGLFLYPNSVTTDDEGNIYVTDTVGKRIVVLDIKKKKVYFWTGGRIKLVSPAGIAFSKKEKIIFVSDTHLRSVFGFSKKGEIIMEIKEKLQRPGGLAVDDKREKLYVVDVRNHDIKVYNLSGELIKIIGKRGDQPGTFNFPNYICLDKKGNIYISDMGNFRIQILSPDGKFLNMFGEPGRRPGNLMRPKGIAIDSENHIYVVDAWFNNIQIFDIYGRVYLAFGSPGVNPGEFLLPIGIHIDEKDRIYVLDQVNKRLQIFQYISYGEKAPLPKY
ncbi:6-bladed beta-propeller [SCandidatus Aminicenantes bacterium Aminicenantia_JdfR_composite]|nr:6-bladed beta-propeller [SCandidatus Aminicenantes bacterium Aminicenantia_JdfR_composite]MCP2598533.1 6-bladed beta-propeller [Candidatus Aminicenantes bacterium AC-335-L06]